MYVLYILYVHVCHASLRAHVCIYVCVYVCITSFTKPYADSEKFEKVCMCIGMSAGSQLILLEVATSLAYVSQLAIEESGLDLASLLLHSVSYLWFGKNGATSLWFELQGKLEHAQAQLDCGGHDLGQPTMIVLTDWS